MSRAAILCRCEFRSSPDSREKFDRLAAVLQSSGYNLHIFGDLCGVCAKEPEKIREIFSADTEMAIFACYPRAVKALLDYAGIGTENRSIAFYNIRNDDVESIIGAVSGGSSEPGSGGKKEIPRSDDWIPWFPVIDRDRCTNCGQCLSFCLFGVYAKGAEGDVQVLSPEKCKTDCPACARICPHTAIIFPKCPAEPFNGALVTGENMNKNVKPSNFGKMSGDEIYKMLSSRMGK